MRAGDDKIGRWKTTQQPTSEIDLQKRVVMVAAIATAAAAATTVTQRHGSNATATVMEAYCQRRAACSLSPEQISVMSALVANRSEAMTVPTRYLTCS